MLKVKETSRRGASAKGATTDLTAAVEQHINFAAPATLFACYKFNRPQCRRRRSRGALVLNSSTVPEMEGWEKKQPTRSELNIDRVAPH